MKNETKWEGHARLIALDKQGEGEEKKHEIFTLEMQERRRDRSNKPFFPRSFSFNSEASKDGIKHFVEGIGDLNPLFVDEEYAKKTKYGKIISPGSYCYSVRWGIPGSMAPGVHGWYVGGDCPGPKSSSRRVDKATCEFCPNRTTTKSRVYETLGST